MTFNSYQQQASKTALYPNCAVETGEHGFNECRWVYPILGLVGEAGELAEKLKKVVRNDNGNISIKTVNDLEKEIGDVLWYIAALCTDLGLNLDDVAQANIDKLQDRMNRGVIKSEGDNR